MLAEAASAGFYEPKDFPGRPDGITIRGHIALNVDES